MNRSQDDSPEASDQSTLTSQTIASCCKSPEEFSELSQKDSLDRVIRRFHNEVGSPLAALAMRMELLRNEKRLDSATEALMAELSQNLGEVIDSVRRSIRELRQLGVSSSQER